MIERVKPQAKGIRLWDKWENRFIGEGWNEEVGAEEKKGQVGRDGDVVCV